MNSSPPSGGVAVISRYGAGILLAGAAVAISYPFRGAPLHDAAFLCGCLHQLLVRRHRPGYSHNHREHRGHSLPASSAGARLHT